MATDIQTTEDDYYEACDRAEEAEAKAADAERWAKFYHDVLIVLRDALPDVIGCAENEARFNDGVWESLEMVKAALWWIDEPTASADDVKARAKAGVDELDRITAWKRGGELLYGGKTRNEAQS